MVNGTAVSLEASTKWDDCPFRASVPDYMEIHWGGSIPKRLTFSLYSPMHELWADSAEALGPGLYFSPGSVLPLVKALALACFDQEFPDELEALEIRRAERGKRGMPPPDADLPAWARYKELGCEISAS